MEMPYTAAPIDAFVAAQSSVGVVLSAVVWHRPIRPLASSFLLLAAMWISILLPVAPNVVAAVTKLPPGADLALLRAAAAIATVAMVLSRPRWLAWIALLGELVLSWLLSWIPDSIHELAALHLVWFAVLYALHARFTRPWERPREPVATPISAWREDLVLFVLGVTLAALVGWFVLDHTMDSADEVGYNFEALVFARLKPYAPVPPCPEAFRSHWVFYENGHAMAMYLPGWSYFLAPFARLRIGWFASSVCMGALVVGVARVARRLGGLPSGRVAAVVVGLGATTLMNGGSQYTHVYIAALWVWSIEALCSATEMGLSARAQWGWGAVVGATMGLMGAARPQDAALLGSGVFLVFVWSLVRRRLSWRTFVATSILFLGIGGFTLVLLHAQYGKWFRVGYEIAGDKYWWAKVRMHLPARDAWKFGFPLMYGAYCYFPGAASVAAAGLVYAGRRIAFMLGLATIALLGFYACCSYSWYRDFGYGPRYQLPLVVAMAIGSGALLGPLFAAMRGRRWWPASFVDEGPAVLAAAAIAVGVLRLAPLLYPYAHEQLHVRSALHRAIERASLTNAVVIVWDGQTGGGPLLDAQNDPLDPDPPVLVLGPQDLACTRATFKDRKFYRAVGREEVTLEPY